MYIDPEYIEMMTGLGVECQSQAVLELAHAKAATLLDNLEEEELVYNVYMTRGGYIVNLPETPNEVSEVAWRRDFGTYQIIPSDHYRVVNQLIKCRQFLPDNCDVKVTYKVGIPAGEDAPELVKLLLVYLYLDTQNSLQPGSVNIYQVESQKIGDYAIKYSLGSGEVSGEAVLAFRIQNLVNLIMNGGTSPGVSID
jgi:hypothetical protein